MPFVVWGWAAGGGGVVVRVRESVPVNHQAVAGGAVGSVLDVPRPGGGGTSSSGATACLSTRC